MIGLQDRKKVNQRRKTFKLILILIFFIILISLGLLNFFGKIFNGIGFHLWNTNNFIKKEVSELGYLTRTKVSVFKENENLKEELGNLKNKMIDYNLVLDENIKLKEILNRIPENYSFVLANILTKPSQSIYDSIIIDIGKDSDVSVGNTVYADSKIPLGIITELYNKTALVTLFSSPDQKIEGYIESSNAVVTLIGRGGGNFEMIVPVDMTVLSGDIILIPNSSIEVVAIVDNVISKPNEPIKKVILHSPINIENLKWVFVRK
jgi:cell shape-determining protein MreC